MDEKIEGLVTKAEKSGMPYGILKKVYDRGMAAYKTGQQTKPADWSNYSVSQLEAAVSNHTADILNALMKPILPINGFK